MLDANSDVLAIISNVFGKVYSHAVNKAITALVETDTTAGKQTTTDLNDAVDKIKTAVITTKTAFGGPTVVIGKKSWAKLALAKDAQKRYLLARDANNSTIKAIEGCAVMVVDDKDISENAVLVGDFSLFTTLPSRLWKSLLLSMLASIKTLYLFVPYAASPTWMFIKKHSLKSLCPNLLYPAAVA